MSVLDGLRILELSEGVAPSIVGMLMADFGAEVVKVERPEGDPTRSDPGFAVWNRGKCSVTFDKGSVKDVGWLAAAVAGADVCILGGGQDLLDWGSEVKQAAVDNRRLVLTHVPPYLASGTPWVGGKESNGLLASAAGVAWRQASDDGTPIEPVYQHLLYVQGLWATVCVTAALLERERSGFGQRVTVTGVNAVMEATVYSITVDPNAPDPETAVGGVGRHPTYRPVRAADGWLACGALGPKFERAVLEILGIDEILDDPRLGGHTANMVLPDNVGWVMERISAAFAEKSRAHWLSALAERGVPAGPLLDREDWLDHPQVLANGLSVRVEDPERGPVVMAGVPLTLTASPGAVRGPAPILGADNGTPAWPAQPRVQGAPPVSAGPLSGYRVLNLGSFIATPYAGFLLSELGADVVKVEPTTGDPFRGAAFTVNRGMRSLAIDLASEQGRQTIRRIGAHIDVVIDGMRPGVMTKLGLDYDSLRQLNPGIITMSLSAYGMHGELAAAGGVDMVVQAMSGMMRAQGEPERPIMNTLAIIDVTTGAMSALAAVLALLHRERTGEGQRTWDSLIGTATFLSSGELVRFADRAPAMTGGPDFKGSEPLRRLYAVNDGWIRVDADASRLSAADLTTVGLVVADLSVDALGRALSTFSCVEAIDILSRAGVPAVVVRRVTALFRDEDLLFEEFAHFRRSSNGTTIATPGRYAMFSRTQRSGPLTPPGVGEHSAEILLDAGFGVGEVDVLLGARAIFVGPRNPLSLDAIYR